MQTLKVLFWNVVFLALFGGLCFAGLEFYLRTYQSFNTETVSAVGVPIFQPDEALTYAHKPNTTAKNGYGIPTPEIVINNVGLRNSEDFQDSLNPQSPPPAPPSGRGVQTKNLLMIGDSFTFGTGVDQNETFSALLEERLNPVVGPLSFVDEVDRGGLADSLDFPTEGNSFRLSQDALTRPTWNVWNAGQIGYSVGQYYLTLKRYHELMDLDAAVVNIFVANDVTELRRKIWHGTRSDQIQRVEDLKVFANDRHQLESRTSVPPKSLAWHWLEQRLQVLRYQLELDDPEFDEPTLTWPVFLAEDHPAWDPRLPKFWERFFQGMQLMVDYANEQEIDLYFVLIPMDVQVDPSYRHKYARIYFDEDAARSDRPQTEIVSFCAARQLRCLDLLPTFRDRTDRDQLYFNYNADPHFDRLGHRVTADLIYRYLGY